MMKTPRGNPFRTFAASTVLGSFVVFGTALGVIPNSEKRRTARLRNNQRLSRLLAKAAGVHMRAEAKDASPSKKAGRLILANHLSVLDVIALASFEEAVFVTSREMEETPVVGHLARIGGVVFIERRSRERRNEELTELTDLLREGRTVVLFPEATSGNGEDILRFRNGLLHAALKIPDVEVVPVCIQYESIGDRAITPENRDRLFLFGEMSVVEHIKNILTNPPVRVRLNYLDSFFAHEHPGAAEIAAHAEQKVRAVYRPVASARVESEVLV